MITQKRWTELYAYLFTKYMDGNVKTLTKVPEGYKYYSPDLEQPGYGDEWYKRIVDETGNQFKYEKASH